MTKSAKRRSPLSGDRRCLFNGFHESQITLRPPQPDSGQTNHQSLFTSHVSLSRRCRDFFLNRRAHQVAPLGPRAVVVADVFIAEQILQDKPGVRAALTDATVGDDFLIARNALASVKLP